MGIGGLAPMRRMRTRLRLKQVYLQCFDSPILRGGQKRSGGDGAGDGDGDGQATVERLAGGILVDTTSDGLLR